MPEDGAIHSTVASGDGQAADVQLATMAVAKALTPDQFESRAEELRQKTADVMSRVAEHVPATKKIAIVGKAPSSWREAPFDKPEWEIWALSDLFKEVPRWTRYFELHNPQPRLEKWSKIRYWDWLQKEHKDEAGNLKPIYMQHRYNEVPNSVPYPKDEIIEKFGNYFTNTISFMIALAIQEGATHISLYGVDMAQQAVGVKSEYAQQRPSCELMLGIAIGKGIKTRVHAKSDLLKCWKLYAYDSDPDAFQVKLLARKQELQAQIDDAQKTINEKTLRQHVLAGALDNMSWLEQWVNASPEQRLDLMGPLQELVRSQFTKRIDDWAHANPAGQQHAAAIKQLLGASDGR